MTPKKLSLLLASGIVVFSSHLCAEGEIAQTVEQQESAPAVHAGAFKSFTGRIVGNRVRMRLSPTIESTVVRETGTGEMFAVVNEDKEFYVVQPSKGTKGYVFRTFILDGVVEGDRVNIRLSPDIDSPVIGRLNSGEKVNAQLCAANNKWLEIALPKTVHFYIAKEYLEHAGPIEMVAQVESRQEQAFHLLHATFLSAQAEIQKPFDEIVIDGIQQKFATLVKSYSDLPEIVAKAKEAETAIEEAYVQKKIVFLESKADRSVASRDVDPAQLQKISQLGRQIRAKDNVGDVGKAASSALGHSAVKSDVTTDKMLVWQSLEESLYHLWAVTHEGKSITDFYEEEAANATVLTGIVESFTKPVKNRPGDYLLKMDNMPVGFLYSTKVNLEDLVGKKVTLMAATRPNNNFAFPAYFVISAE